MHTLDTLRLNFDQGSATPRIVYATHMSHVKDKAHIKHTFNTRPSKTTPACFNRNEIGSFGAQRTPTVWPTSAVAPRASLSAGQGDQQSAADALEHARLPLPSLSSAPRAKKVRRGVQVKVGLTVRSARS